MTENEINVTATCIAALANQPNSEEKIKLLLTSLFGSYEKEGYFNEPKNNSKYECSAPLLFTEKEVSKMPKPFRKLFRTNKICAHVRKRSDGLYEIRCMVDLKPITAVSKYLEIAKEKFIEKLKLASVEIEVQQSSGTNFNSYLNRWLETAKKPHVKENTYGGYCQTVRTNIKPEFEERNLEEITYMELQSLITEYQEGGKNRTAKKIYQLLCGVFDSAVADRLIPISPMLKVKLTHYETESGVPFTREEEKQLIENFKSEPTLYRQAFVFMMYTGIRRAELSSVVIEDGWVHLVSAKQRKGFKEKIRSLPIPPILQPYLPSINIDEIIKISPHLLTKHLHKQFNTHHCHDLRHTFVTRAQECKIPREYVSLWAGHTADSSITTTIYTHLEQNKDLQVEEMQKFQYELN